MKERKVGRPKGPEVEWVIVQLRLQPETATGLDDLRRAHPEIPSRAEMVRLLVEDAVKAKPKKGK